MQPNPLRSPLLQNVTAEGASAVRDVSSFQYLAVICEGTGTIDSGVITIEEASAVTFTGTWSAIDTVNGADLTAGAAQAVHLPVSAYSALRVRVSTAIGGGGSISALLVAT